MTGAPVRFEHVWKRFRRGERHDSLRDQVPALVRRLFRRRRTPVRSADEFWALSDVSFEVPPGKALGVIGPNGAGKSTVLKVLTKILRPTTGCSTVIGRVGALIEIAAGFHADLTGRENIYLQGAIMGMKRAEIDRKLDAIVDFAGVGEFIDTPVKRYSSGMNARLGFSIAANLEPDVLVIDEVLSVGDMAFQQRCVDRMREFKRNGTAIVFVSHNLQAVSDLCERTVYLRSAMRACGPTPDVVRAYVEDQAGRAAAAGPGAIGIVYTELLDSTGRPCGDTRPGTLLMLRVRYAVHARVEDVHLGLVIHRSTDGLAVADGYLDWEQLGPVPLEPGQEFTAEFRFRAHLARGQYHLESHVYHNPTQRYLHRVSPAALLTIQETRGWGGIADVELTSRIIARDHACVQA